MKQKDDCRTDAIVGPAGRMAHRVSAMGRKPLAATLEGRICCTSSWVETEKLLLDRPACAGQAVGSKSAD